MKLIVREQEHKIHLGLPTGIVLNRGTAVAMCRAAKKHGVLITYRQMVIFLKALNTYRKTHKEWVLLEVNGAKGEYVQIKL